MPCRPDGTRVKAVMTFNNEFGYQTDPLFFHFAIRH